MLPSNAVANAQRDGDVAEQRSCERPARKKDSPVLGLSFFGAVAKRSERPARKKDSPVLGLSFFGADNQIRTGDLVLTKDVLYLLSHISKIFVVNFFLPYNNINSVDKSQSFVYKKNKIQQK